MTPPSPVVIRIARAGAGLTQAEAAQLVHLGAQSRWAEYENGTTRPDAARWELFLLFTHQHPTYFLKRKKEANVAAEANGAAAT